MAKTKIFLLLLISLLDQSDLDRLLKFSFDRQTKFCGEIRNLKISFNMNNKNVIVKWDKITFRQMCCIVVITQIAVI